MNYIGPPALGYFRKKWYLQGSRSGDEVLIGEKKQTNKKSWTLHEGGAVFWLYVLGNLFQKRGRRRTAVLEHQWCLSGKQHTSVVPRTLG